MLPEVAYKIYFRNYNTEKAVVMFWNRSLPATFTAKNLCIDASECVIQSLSV
jgi:hypothetical protein